MNIVLKMMEPILRQGENEAQQHGDTVTGNWEGTEHCGNIVATLWQECGNNVATSSKA